MKKIGRREKRYTRWLPVDGEGLIGGKEEAQRVIAKEKKWRDEHSPPQVEESKGEEVVTGTDHSAPTVQAATKRKLDTIDDLPDNSTANDCVSEADVRSSKKVLVDFKSSCMDGRTIKVYQEIKRDLNTPRSFAERYPGLTYDTIVQRTGGLQDTTMAESEGDDEGLAASVSNNGVVEDHKAATTGTATVQVPSSAATDPAQALASGTDDFTVTTTYTTLMTKASSTDNLAFTPEDLALAESLMPQLGKYQRKKLRKRLGIKPPSTARPGRLSTADGYHGGTPKGRRPRRGVPVQPRGPKKEKMFDCRDGVLGNCPPDCAGRRHKKNGKVEQQKKAKSKGVLLFGGGVEIGAWHSSEVVGRVKKAEVEVKAKQIEEENEQVELDIKRAEMEEGIEFEGQKKVKGRKKRNEKGTGKGKAVDESIVQSIEE